MRDWLTLHLDTRPNRYKLVWKPLGTLFHFFVQQKIIKKLIKNISYTYSDQFSNDLDPALFDSAAAADDSSVGGGGLAVVKKACVDSQIDSAFVEIRKQLPMLLIFLAFSSSLAFFIF